MTECPNRFTLLRWRTDDLPALEQVEVDRHVTACPECRRLAVEIDADMAAYAERADEHSERLARALRREKAGASASVDDFGALFKTRIAPALGIAMAAAAIAILIVRPFDPGTVEDEEADISFKGGLSLEVVARRGEEQFAVGDETVLAKDDALRFVVTTATAGYLSIFSVDALGAPTCFYPDTDPAEDPDPQRIYTPGRNVLPGSIVLDGSTGNEQLVAVFSADRFDRREVHERLRGAAIAGRLFPRIDGLTVESLRIEKAPRVK